MPTTATFFSENSTGTFADALIAAGAAGGLSAFLEALGRRSEPVRIRDCGSYFRIETPTPLSREDAKAVTSAFMAGQGQPIVTARMVERADKQGEPIPAGYEYEEHRAQRDAYFQRWSKLTADERRAFRRNPGAFPELGAAPDSDLSLYVAINHFKVADAYNGLIERWLGGRLGLAGFQTNLELLFDRFSVMPNWSPERPEEVSALQIVNPSSGKGGNAAKADSLGIGNVSGLWLDEYLKFVGFFTIAAPVVVRKAKDRKTFVLHPVDVPSVAKLGEVMRDFRGGFGSSTATKVDILVSLRFTETLVEAIRRELVARQVGTSTDSIFGLKPRVTDVSRGFDMAFYKDMGSAFATMNLATINLPRWLPEIGSPQVAELALVMLQEHLGVVGSIQTSKGEERSEEVELLQRYRDFLSGDDVTRFFDFAARLGDYVLGKRRRNQFARQFTTTGLETLVNTSGSLQTFGRITANEGFRAVAAAIRAATVTAQYHAARGNQPYEVRYGLGQALLRSASYPEDFLSALAEFAQSYNAECARIDERIAKGHLPSNTVRRRAIQARHLDEIVTLIDEYRNQGGAGLIGRLLIAYGYARDPGKQPDDGSKGGDVGAEGPEPEDDADTTGESDE